jgi:(p)ppGpp synthase/HD superfamily hydrolase
MMTLEAIRFAAQKHLGQIRKSSGLPYITHTIIVMEMIQRYKGCSKNIEELKCAAILHDTLEDTACDYNEIEHEFGPMVASLVLELTSDEAEIKRIGKNEYLKQKMLKMTGYAFILKLLDRMSNCLDAPRPVYLSDTIELIDFLLENRTTLSQRQIGVMKEIKNICLTGDIPPVKK